MKTNFYKSLKLFLFLLFTVLSSSTILAETIPPKVVISPIGGGRSPWPDFSYALRDINNVSLTYVNESLVLSSCMDSIMLSVLKISDMSLIAVGGKSTPKPILFECVSTSLANEMEIRVMDLPRGDLAFHLMDLHFELPARDILFSS